MHQSDEFLLWINPFGMTWVFFYRILFSLEDLYFAPWHQRGGWEALTWVLHERRFLFRDDIQDTCPAKGDLFKQTFKMSVATEGPKCSLKLDFLKIPRGLHFSSACYKWKVNVWAKLEIQQCNWKKKKTPAGIYLYYQKEIVIITKTLCVCVGGAGTLFNKSLFQAHS